MNIRLDRRISSRRNTMIEAEIVFDAGKTRVACIIRNISDTGAKLEVTSVAKIPQSFDLRVPEQRPRACRVAWRTLRELGVAFYP